MKQPESGLESGITRIEEPEERLKPGGEKGDIDTISARTEIADELFRVFQERGQFMIPQDQHVLGSKSFWVRTAENLRGYLGPQSAAAIEARQVA